MISMMLATTAAGSIASYVLLHMGVSHFGVRYALAVLAAYGALFGMIVLWARYEERRLLNGDDARSDASDALDVLNGGNSGGSTSSGGGSPRFAGGGGRSAGGGASASYEVASPRAALVSSGSAKSGGGGGGGSLDLDGDELIVVILVVLAIAGALLAAGYIIWVAPTFLGDVLASGVAGVGISHRITQHEPGWMGLVLKRTAVPACAVVMLFTFAGFALEHYAPGARTLHGAWQVHIERHAKD